MKAASLAAGIVPFERAAQMLKEIGDIDISARQVQEIAEGIGAEIEGELQERNEKAENGQIEQEEPPEILVVGVDGTTAHTREEGWKEVKVGVVARYHRKSTKEMELEKASYVARLETVEDFKPFVWAEAQRQGEKGKEATLFLGDGSPWVWNVANECFPGAIQILDYYHVSEKVHGVGILAYDETDKAKEWAEEVLEKLRTGLVDVAIDMVKTVPMKSEEGKNERRLAVDYLENNRERIRYKEMEEKGYPIGSGIVESSCKHVVGMRHKQAGMHWSKPRLQQMLNLTTLIQGNDWDRFWRRRKAA